jgi:hypothetical protein
MLRVLDEQLHRARLDRTQEAQTATLDTLIREAAGRLLEVRQRAPLYARVWS